MNRFVQSAVIALLISCAPRCNDDRNPSRVADLKAPTQALAAETSIRPIPKARDVASINPADLPRQKLIYATRTSCMAPCAVQLDAQKGASLTWPEVRDSEYVWDFDDGGSRTDSEGFLAAVVYEKAGTYHPTVTVDGETWNVQTITVLDPTRTVCVGTDFSACPSAAGGDHFATISAALTATNGEARRHILLKRGGSYGALPSGNATPTMIGAYGSGNKPALTTNGTELYPNWSYQDVAVTSTGGDAPFRAIRGAGALLLRVTATGTSNAQLMYAEQGFFIVDSDITSDRYVLYTSNADRMVVKNTVMTRNSPSGDHTFRHQGGNKLLVQGSSLTATTLHTSLTVRGNTAWALVQDNYFNQTSGPNPQYVGANELQQYMVWERNSLDGGSNLAGIGLKLTGHDMIVRNNVSYNVGGTAFKAESISPITTQNIWFINNTAFTTKVGNDGVVCSNTAGCVIKNNLVYSTQRLDNGCFPGGGTQLNNWCRSSNGCIDPVTGGSTCYEPSFVSTTCGTVVNGKCTNAGFATPGAGTRGINAGAQSVPVWDDYDNVDRSTIDVGAVAR